ncbi:MAG: LacI family DNA-binding transcriptional regulator [Sphingomonadales bacterium]|nr:LacI family DNA-binding transcriptional regulator [Sphingomonadales bacterium]
MAEVSGKAGSRGSRRAGKGPTLADVARGAGVSAMTVSRVINREAKVQPETRDRVRAVIRQLGYVPNTAARSLAGGQQCRVALLYDNPSAAYLSELLVGSLAQASESDAELLVERMESTEALVPHLLAHRVDGVIVPPPLSDDAELVSALTAAGLSVALVAGTPLAEVCIVSIDDRAAAAEMTRHLIALGHRRIGFIAGNPNQAASALRRAGYEDALRDAGIAPDPALLAQGDFSYRSGLTAAEALLAQGRLPTAIFASNDDMAAAAVAAAHRRGLDVPRDLSVCGFDDSALATIIWPELTTVRQPIGDMARLATRRVIEAVRGSAAGKPRPAVHDRLAFQIVRRLSDGAPQAGSAR